VTCRQMTSTDIRIELRELGATAEERDAICDMRVRPPCTPSEALAAYRMLHGTPDEVRS